MRDVLAGWLILCGLATLAWVTVGECATRSATRTAERRKQAAEQARTMAPLIVAYDQACSPHPLHDDVIWVSTDNDADAWKAIGGSAA